MPQTTYFNETDPTIDYNETINVLDIPLQMDLSAKTFIS